jgi:hypothetical protein
VTDAAPIPQRTQMSPRDRRRFLWGLAIFAVVAALVATPAYMYLHRHDTICKDGKPPVAQRNLDVTLIQYQCHNGQLVTG